MGTLTPVDTKLFSKKIILAILSRDYRRVAQLHIDSGWVNKHTRIDEFESAIRTVCEPIFEKPLAQISFGNLLLKLFQTAERFDMKVQPQLMLLQKTLFYIESLGRKLYPELDLWETAKPFMTKWMRKQRGPRALLKLFLKDFHANSEKIAELPPLLYQVLLKISRS
jgi:Predicted unusual protein kinase